MRRIWVLSLGLWGCAAPPPSGPDPVATSVATAERASREDRAPPASSASASATADSPVASASAPEPPETPPPGWKPIPARRPNGFPGIEFSEVRAFAFDLEVAGRPICRGPLDPDGTTCSTVARPGVKLTSEQTKKLTDLLAARSSYGGGSACFLPHHGFVFYDAAGVPVAELSVCFLCDMAEAHPAIPIAKPSDAGATTVGITEKGVAGLRALCNELGLPKCDARRPEDFGP